MREVKQEEIMRDHGDMIRVMETAILRNVELRICKNIMMNRRGQAKKGACGEPQVGNEPQMSEWSNPHGKGHAPYTEHIGIRGEPPELKHLSRARKRNQPRYRK